jgi:hypothetical protein
MKDQQWRKKGRGAVLVAVTVRAMQHAAANSLCAVHAEVAGKTARSGAVGASR